MAFNPRRPFESFDRFLKQLRRLDTEQLRVLEYTLRSGQVDDDVKVHVSTIRAMVKEELYRRSSGSKPPKLYGVGGGRPTSENAAKRKRDNRNAKLALSLMTADGRKIRHNDREDREYQNPEFGYVSKPYINWNVLLCENYPGEAAGFRTAEVVGHVQADSRQVAASHAKHQLRLTKEQLARVIFIPGRRYPIGTRRIDGEWISRDPSRRERLRARNRR